MSAVDCTVMDAARAAMRRGSSGLRLKAADISITDEEYAKAGMAMRLSAARLKLAMAA
jgi:hypothetical protein